MPYYLLDIPSVPDWIAAIAALIGVVFGGVSLWKLLSRDKDKQQQLDTLAAIATEQNKISNKLQLQLQEFIKQTIEFQEQTKLMYELNRIILGYSLREEEKLKLERKEQLLKIKPWFNVNLDSFQSSGQVVLKLINRKSAAHDFSIRPVKASFTTFSIAKYNNIENSQTVTLVVNTEHGKYYENLSDLEFEIEFYYKDLNENQYYQTLKKTDRYDIDEPILVEN